MKIFNNVKKVEYDWSEKGKSVREYGIDFPGKLVEYSEYEKLIDAVEWIMGETAIVLNEKQEAYIRHHIRKISGYTKET